jgi:transcriptional regulator with GAF, ATPase, and Fis domain
VEIGELASRLVGTSALDKLQSRLAEALLREALRRSAGNYTRAAELLGVTRQAVQQMVVRFGLRPLAEDLRKASTHSLVMRIRESPIRI